MVFMAHNAVNGHFYVKKISRKVLILTTLKCKNLPY